jgi:hypothetical protein
MPESLAFAASVEAAMRISVPSRLILSALLVALAAPVAAWPQEEKPKAKIQRKKQAPQTAPAQTQTAPAQTQTAPGKEKGKPQTAPAGPTAKGKGTQTAPGKAGLRAIQGMVDSVFPERNAVMIRTSTNEYQVFVTPQTVLIRGGEPAQLKQIRRGDRVDYCHYNAKNVVQKMSVTPADKISSTPPPPPPEL